MSVNSNDNKALLWNLLSKHPNQKKDHHLTLNCDYTLSFVFTFFETIFFSGFCLKNLKYKNLFQNKIKYLIWKKIKYFFKKPKTKISSGPRIEFR